MQEIRGFVERLRSPKDAGDALLREWATAWVQSGSGAERRLQPELRDVLAGFWLGGSSAVAVLEGDGRVKLRAFPKDSAPIGNLPGRHSQPIPGATFGFFPGGRIRPGRHPIAPAPLPPQELQRRAAGMFIAFLQSPAASNLYMCDYCGGFFMRERQSCKDSGFCRECRSAGSIARQRARQHEQRLAMARREWESAGRPKASAAVKRRLCDRLNRSLHRGRDVPFTLTWLTRNWTQITREESR